VLGLRPHLRLGEHTQVASLVPAVLVEEEEVVVLRTQACLATVVHTLPRGIRQPPCTTYRLQALGRLVLLPLPLEVAVVVVAVVALGHL
jgi:hypothetical protein